MKGKFKKILSVFLCAVMVFTAFSTAFASGEQEEEHVWCDVRPTNGLGMIALTKGKSDGLYVAYNPGSHEGVKLEWSSKGDSCVLELAEPDEESGLIQRATVTSVSYGNFDVTVKLVAADGTVLDEDTFTVISRTTKWGVQFAAFKAEMKLAFYIFGLLPALSLPMGAIAKIMEIFGADDETVRQFIYDYGEWMSKVMYSFE